MTLRNTNRWLNEIRVNISKDVCFILIGNKKDLENQRLIKNEEGEKLT